MTEANSVDQQPQVGLLAQYVKDFSFENPNAPGSLQMLQQVQPKVDMNLNIGSRPVGQDVFEVELRIQITAKQNTDTAFIVELNYCGLFGARNLPEDTLEMFLYVNCPGILWPYARRIVATAMMDGGFPPAIMDFVDFGALYLQRREQLDGAGGDIAQA